MGDEAVRLLVGKEPSLIGILKKENRLRTHYFSIKIRQNNESVIEKILFLRITEPEFQGLWKVLKIPIL